MGTDNEEVMENTVFDKKQEQKNSKADTIDSNNGTNVTVINTSDVKKMVQSTKKLTIPLKKLKNDSISNIQPTKPETTTTLAVKSPVLSKTMSKPLKPNLTSLVSSGALKVTKQT